MGTNAVLSQIPGAAGYKGSEEAEGWAGGSGGILGSLSLRLDQALPQTSPRSQGCIAVPVIKLLVPRVCNDLCREHRLARISCEQGRAPQSTPGTSRAGLLFPQPPWHVLVLSPSHSVSCYQ